MKLLHLKLSIILTLSVVLMAVACSEESVYTGVPLGEGNEVTNPALDTQKPTLPEDVKGEPTKA